MNKVVSEDALRRAMERIDEAASAAWMRPALMHSVREALDRPWVLDIDASIKPLYGRQEGAEIGYNPSKPMRPSHVLHTFVVSNLRLVLEVQLSTGKQHTSGHAKAALGRLLDELGDKRPALVRGDSGYGNEGILLELEARCQPYLLRLRQTANVQRLVAQAFGRTDWSRPDAQGCQMIEGQVRLSGWSRTRRVVIVCQRIKGGIARQRRVDRRQLQLDGTVDPGTFSSSDDVWAPMASPNPARFTTLTSAGGSITVDTCPNAYTNFNGRLPAQLTRIQGKLACQLNPTLPAAAANAAIAGQIQQAYLKNSIGIAAATAADLIRQNAVLNAINDTSNIFGQKVNDPAAMVLAVGRARSVAQ